MVFFLTDPPLYAAAGGFGFGPGGNGPGGNNGFGNGQVTVNHGGNVGVTHSDVNVYHHPDEQTLTQMDQLQQNWSGTNQSLDQMNQNWNGTNQSIDGVSHQWGRTNQTLETLTNPMNLGMLAVAGGAGLAIGSAIATGVITLVKTAVVSLYRFLHEKITHKKENEQLIQEFNKAAKDYDSIMKATRHLDLALKKLLAIQNQYVEANESWSRDKALTHLTQWTAHLKTLKKINEKSANTALEADDYKSLEQSELKTIQLETDLNQLSDITKLIQEDRSPGLCESIYKFYYELVASEEQLESFRADLLAAKKEWFRRFREHQKIRQKKMDRVAHDAWDIYKEAKKGTKSYSNAEIKKIKGDQKKFHDGCVRWYKSKNLHKFELRDRLAELYKINQSGVFVFHDDGLSEALPDGYFGKKLAWKYFYRQAICRQEYISLYSSESQPIVSKNDYYSHQKTLYQESAQKISETYLDGYHQTMKHIHYLRKNPSQYAEAVSANLFKHFEQIETDQRDFNNPDTEMEHSRVTKGRFHLDSIVRVCGEAPSKRVFIFESRN